MKNRARDIKIFAYILNKIKGKKPSIRQISNDTDIPKSSVHRRKKAIEQRDIYPESYFWETEEGILWLKRFLLALVISLMIKRRVGAPTILELLHLLHLQHHIGSSADTLNKICDEVEKIILQYGQEQEEQNQEVQLERVLELILGNDEVFFNHLPLLVSMELKSGFIFLEEKCEDRTYETWAEKLKRVLPIGAKVVCTISDKAAALLKLGSEALGTLVITDLFHAIWGISKKLGASLGRLKRKATKALAAAEIVISIKSANIQQQIGLGEDRSIIIQQESYYELVVDAQKCYQEEMRNIILQVHPFKITGGIQSSTSAEQEIRSKLDVLNALSEQWKIAGGKEAISKFERDLYSICLIIDTWWLLFRENLKELGLTAEEEDWLINTLLPAVYWKVQIIKTDSKEMAKSYRETLERALEKLKTHPFTKEIEQQEYQQLESWCRNIVEYFQRTSSAVEGRNGQLSQFYHCGRGLSSQELRVLTILHNYDHKRVNGFTPAENLYGRAPPNLFDYVLARFDHLPKSRKRERTIQNNFLNIKICPALSL